MQEWKSVLFLWVYSLKGGEQLSIIQQKYGKSIRLNLFSFDMTYYFFIDVEESVVSCLLAHNTFIHHCDVMFQ